MAIIGYSRTSPPQFPKKCVILLPKHPNGIMLEHDCGKRECTLKIFFPFAHNREQVCQSVKDLLLEKGVSVSIERSMNDPRRRHFLLQLGDPSTVQPIFLLKVMLTEYFHVSTDEEVELLVLSR